MWLCSPIPSPIPSITVLSIKGLGAEPVVILYSLKETGWNKGQLSAGITETGPALHQNLACPDTRCRMSTFPEL